jgi:hypothetical protein
VGLCSTLGTLDKSYGIWCGAIWNILGNILRTLGTIFGRFMQVSIRVCGTFGNTNTSKILN